MAEVTLISEPGSYQNAIRAYAHAKRGGTSKVFDVRVANNGKPIGDRIRAMVAECGWTVQDWYTAVEPF